MKLLSKKTASKQCGFTLIEMILYIGLLVLFLSAIITFVWDGIYAGIKSEAQQELTYNIQFVAERLNLEITEASSIYSISATDLCLENPDAARNPTRIYLSGSQIRQAWGGGSTDCTTMTNDEPLNSDAILVNSINLEELDNTGIKSLRFELVFEHQLTNSRPAWDLVQVATSSALLRATIP